MRSCFTHSANCYQLQNLWNTTGKMIGWVWRYVETYEKETLWLNEAEHKIFVSSNFYLMVYMVEPLMIICLELHKFLLRICVCSTQRFCIVHTLRLTLYYTPYLITLVGKFYLHCCFKNSQEHIQLILLTILFFVYYTFLPSIGHTSL